MKKIILFTLTALLCASTMQPAFGMDGENEFFSSNGQPSLLPEDSQRPVQNVTIMNIGLVPIPVVPQQELQQTQSIAENSLIIGIANSQHMNALITALQIKENNHRIEKHNRSVYKFIKEQINTNAKADACAQGISLGLGIIGMKAAYNLPSDSYIPKIMLYTASACSLLFSYACPAVYKKLMYKDIKGYSGFLPEHRRRLKKKCHEKFFWPSAIAKALPISGAVAANMHTTSSSLSTTALETAKIFPAVLAVTAGAAYINNGFWRTYKKWSRG